MELWLTVNGKRTCASAPLRVLSDTAICFTPGIKKPAGAG